MMKLSPALSIFSSLNLVRSFPPNNIILQNIPQGKQTKFDLKQKNYFLRLTIST